MTALLSSILATTLHLPPALSNHAAGSDRLFYFIGIIYVVFQVIITVVTVFFFVAYRKKKDEAYRTTLSLTHSTALEITWTVIPTVIVFFVFWWGFKGYMSMWIAPKGAYEITVEAQQWGWTFSYPEGFDSTDLVVPVDRPVKLLMSSKDVIHSLYIPDFRVKFDVVPKRYSSLWFTALQEAEVMTPERMAEQIPMPTADDPAKTIPRTEVSFKLGETYYEHLDLFCTEYCGTAHSTMYAKVVPLNEGDFQKWKDANAFDPNAKPWERGAKLYKTSQCYTCHSIDGSAMTGPTYKGIWGKEETVLEAGVEKTVLVDENYIRQSILQPASQIVKGFPNQMNAFQLSNQEIMDLAWFIRSQGDGFDPSVWTGPEAATEGDPAPPAPEGTEQAPPAEH